MATRRPSTSERSGNRKRALVEPEELPWISYLPSVIKVLRDIVLLVVGVWGIVHETITPKPDPQLIILFGTMVGLPAFIRADERSKPK